VSDSRKPRGAIAARRRSVVAYQNAPDDILIDRDAESACDLLGNLAAAEVRVAPFHPDQRIDQLS
jgi:hypothetical protein